MVYVCTLQMHLHLFLGRPKLGKLCWSFCALNIPFPEIFRHGYESWDTPSLSFFDHPNTAAPEFVQQMLLVSSRFGSSFFCEFQTEAGRSLDASFGPEEIFFRHRMQY